MLINQIEDDVYVLIGDAYHSNSTAFVAQDDVLLIDALGSRADAEKLQQWVEKELRKQVRFIICTHFFADHLAALNLFPRASVIAHKDYRETFDSERYVSDEEKTHFREPDILVSDEIRIRWGRHFLDVFHNPGHTPSTLCVDIKDANLLMVSDTLVGNIVYLAYSTPAQLAMALDRLRARARSRVISSHGNVRSNAAIGNAEFYLQSLRDRINEARASADDEESLLQVTLEACLPSGIEPTTVEQMYHQRNLHAILENRWCDL